ncbi:sensor histidine kinase [Xanthomonas indica]|uniref:histidine kinase n=1 Tax=Xanthomonas indica TaxID=2912242 RepID=A0AAU8I4N4_9XANT|nr:sensor histidine kinase [Xanthomonas indica]MCI2262818.1 sensor histidine kinase [Xanthomonas indica]
MMAQWWRWLAGAWLLVGMSVGLAATPAPHAVAALPLTAAHHDASGYLQRLDDPQGRLDAAQAAAARGWTRLPAGLNAGFVDGPVWLRLPVHVESVPPGGWMLRLSNALLDDVQAYVRSDGGAWRALGRSGERVPRRDWPVDYRSPVFQFAPSQAGDYEVLLRLRSKNALVTRLDVWQRLPFDNQSRREGLQFGLYFGFYLLLLCLHVLFWLATRARMSGLFVAYLGGCVFNEAMSIGLVQQVTGMPMAWSDSLLGISIACSLPVGFQVASRQLNLRAFHPRLVRWGTRFLWAVAFGGAVAVLAGHYAWGMRPVQTLGLLEIVLLVGLGVHLLWRRYRPALFFVLAFFPFYLGVMLGFLRNLGFVPVNAWTQYATTFGTMLHMTLLSVFLIARYERQRRLRERRHADAAVELARRHGLALEREVTLRTAELRNEIGRRQALEDDLRALLQTERKVAQEQRDFVAMVSHEFRTPLAVIMTSAQQLARKLDAPAERNRARCGNIRDAAQRLLALVDEYLADDRMGETASELRLQPCALRALLAELCLDFPSQRVLCEFLTDDDGLLTDLGLLRVALRNLIANADRHCPEGMAIRVRVRGSDERLWLEVANPGERIAPAEQERLFQKYYRGENARHAPGAGLGLYLVRRIAERLGGSVELSTQPPGESVCFVLLLPRRPVLQRALPRLPPAADA